MCAAVSYTEIEAGLSKVILSWVNEILVKQRPNGLEVAFQAPLSSLLCEENQINL